MEEKIWQFFINRKKNSRIPDEFKVRLVLDMKKNSLTLSEIWRKYFLCYSTARIILKEVTQDPSFVLNSEARYSRRRLEQPYIKKSIDNLLGSSKSLITIKKIRAHIMKEWSADLSWHKVREYLRKTKRLSFKKGWTRRVDLDRNRLSYLRILYSIRLTKQLNKDILIINIDEVNFSPEVLNWRSWLKTGINWEIFSQKYSGAISAIWAITSKGDYISAALNLRLNSSSFIEFLKILRQWINQHYKIDEDRVLILLDNWPIHRSKISKEYMNTTGNRYMFIPHYTPSLAPIELVFAKMKRIIADIDTNEISNWRSSKGINIIRQSLHRVSSWEIMRCWTHWLNISEKYIDCFKHHLTSLK